MATHVNVNMNQEEEESLPPTPLHDIQGELNGAKLTEKLEAVAAINNIKQVNTVLSAPPAPQPKAEYGGRRRSHRRKKSSYRKSHHKRKTYRRKTYRR